MRKKRARIEFKRVDVEQFKPPISETRAQKIRQSPVLFDRKNTRAFLENKESQRAESGSNLDDIIIRSDLRLIDNPASKILFVQKILSERFGWREVEFSKRGSYVRQLHESLARRTMQAWELISLFTKLCEQNPREPRSYSQVIQWTWRRSPSRLTNAACAGPSCDQRDIFVAHLGVTHRR